VYNTVEFRMCHVGFHDGRHVVAPGVHGGGSGGAGGIGGIGGGGAQVVGTADDVHAARVRQMMLYTPWGLSVMLSSGVVVGGAVGSQMKRNLALRPSGGRGGVLLPPLRVSMNPSAVTLTLGDAMLPSWNTTRARA